MKEQVETYRAKYGRQPFFGVTNLVYKIGNTQPARLDVSMIGVLIFYFDFAEAAAKIVDVSISFLLRLYMFIQMRVILHFDDDRLYEKFHS